MAYYASPVINHSFLFLRTVARLSHPRAISRTTCRFCISNEQSAGNVTLAGWAGAGALPVVRVNAVIEKNAARRFSDRPGRKARN